jgi:hypothetical protein
MPDPIRNLWRNTPLSLCLRSSDTTSIISLIFTTPKRRGSDCNIMLTQEYVREIFRGLEDGSGEVFFNHVSDDVDWIVMGINPLAGHYHSKDDVVNGTCAKLKKVLQEGPQLAAQPGAL